MQGETAMFVHGVNVGSLGDQRPYARCIPKGSSMYQLFAAWDWLLLLTACAQDKHEHKHNIQFVHPESPPHK